MTSQVAVANHSGVAVASDTVTTSFFGGGAKTIGNANKIWEIGKSHRVLVLLSDAVTQNGVTLKLLVGEWAATLTKPLLNLEDYVDSFTEWMSTEHFIHSAESEVNRAWSLLNNHFYEVKRRAEAHWYSIPLEEEFTSREEVLTRFAQEGLEYLKSLEIVEGLIDDSDFAEFLTHSEFNLKEKIETIFEEVGLNLFNVKTLEESAPLILSRSQYFPGNSTLAFVGYGSGNFFPRNMTLSIRGFYGGKFIYSKGQLNSIHPERGAGITAFAQDEAIFGFLRGIRWEMVNFIATTLEEKVNLAVENLEGQNLGAEIAQELRESIEHFYRRRFIDPLLDSIEGLDISHLANLADSLVGMEATSAFGGDGPATVGGLIEVATIDRQHGVRWVKTL